MNTKHCSCFIAVLIWLAGCFSTTIAEESIVTSLQSAQSHVQFFRETIPLKPQLVLATNNPIRGAGPVGSMMLWLHDGVPEVAVSIFQWQEEILHEVDSLSRSGNVHGESQTGQQWRPLDKKIKFNVVDRVMPPGDVANRRLLQMKAISRLFQVKMLGFNESLSDREELRCLPTPIYRYRLPETTSVDSLIVDGGVFAFVQATDPEALLIVEAVRVNNEMQWQYAIVRSTGAGLEGRFRDIVVFEAQRFPPDSDPKSEHFTFRQPAIDIGQKPASEKSSE